VAVDGKGLKVVGVVAPNVLLPKLGVVPEPNEFPKLPKLVVLGVVKPDPKDGVGKVEPKPPLPNAGVDEVDENVVEPKPGVVPNEVPPKLGVNDEPKPVVPVPKPMAGVVPPKLKGAVVDPNIELVVLAPNEPKPVEEGAPNPGDPKLVVGVELNAPKPDPNEGLVVGVVPKLDPNPELVPNGDVVAPNAPVLGEVNENGLDEGAAPNIPVPVVPKGDVVLLLPNGDELCCCCTVPNVLVVPKGEAALLGPPWCSQRNSSKLLLA